MAAKEPKTVIFYINLGGGAGNVGAMRYAWRAKADHYKNIGEVMGVVKAKDTDSALMFGSNSPKPAKVRIGYVGADGSSKSIVRFCEPDKIGDVTTGGKINGKEVVVNGKAYSINNVTIKTN